MKPEELKSRRDLTCWVEPTGVGRRGKASKAESCEPSQRIATELAHL